MKMGLENVRLLIVVENFDPQTDANEIDADEWNADTFLASEGSSEQTHLPTQLSSAMIKKDVDPARAIDRHILEAATYWRSQLQEVAIYAACAPDAYNEVSPSGVQLIGSGIPAEVQPLLTSASFGKERRRSRTPQTPLSADWPFTVPEPASQTPLPTERNRIRPVADYCPTHLVICTPNAAILNWANRNEMPSVVLLCDWREPLGWWQRWQHKQLIKQLNAPSVSWVGSHGAYACKILCASGISPQKLIPWRWPQPQLPVQYKSRQLRYDRSTIALLYVGSMHSDTGVDDLLYAVSHLHQRGQAAQLQIICETPICETLDEKAELSDGERMHPIAEDTLQQPAHPISTAADTADDIIGNISASRPDLESAMPDRDLRRLNALVKALDLMDHVSFTPAMAEPKLLTTMRNSDLVVIPGYDQTWPAATPPSLQLAMATRTPVIASDHDQLKEYLFHGVNAMIFPIGNPKSMAHRIERVMAQPQLYAQLSEALDIPLHAIKVPARWADLIEQWLQSDEASPAGSSNYQRLCNWAFSSGRYQRITPVQKVAKKSQKKV